MTSTPVASARAAPFPSAPQWRRARGLLRSWLPRLGWTIVSVGLFAAIWELCWYFGWADPRLLPPPHDDRIVISTATAGLGPALGFSQ